MIFQRKDTGKTVKAVLNRFKIFPAEKRKKLKIVLRQILAGKASAPEKKEKRAMLYGLVKKVLLDTPEGVLKITPMADYKFPQSAKN